MSLYENWMKKANNRGGNDNISVAYLIRDEEGEDK